MPAALSTFQQTAKDSVEDCLSKAPATIEKMQSVFQEQFGSSQESSLSSVHSKIAMDNASTMEENAAVSTVLASSLDMADATLTLLALFDRYITLTFPKMEDGNNFGVTIQLALTKSMSDSREKIEKAMEELLKYTAARADALEKCKNLTSTTTTTVQSKGHSNNEGSNKDGPIKTQECKESGEEKMTSTTVSSPELVLRQKAVSHIDLLYFRKAKSLYETALTAYMMAVDFMDKNKAKIDEPKGNDGGRSAFSSMY